MTDTTATDELRTMTRIVKALDALDRDAQVRVVAWMFERFMGHAAEPTPRVDA